MYRLALILSALLVVVACGDGDTTPGTEPTPTPAGEDVSDDFADLSEGFASAAFTVTYQMETLRDGEPLAAEWTWYRADDGDRARFDFDGALAGFEDEMIVISTPERSVICVGGACLGAPEGGPVHGNPAEGFAADVMDIEDRVLAGEVRDAGTREIAGVEARCFEFDSDGAEEASGMVCLSPDGVPLFADIESAEGTFTLEATAYSDSVSDEDFEPPHDVTEI